MAIGRIGGAFADSSVAGDSGVKFEEAKRLTSFCFPLTLQSLVFKFVKLSKSLALHFYILGVREFLRLLGTVDGVCNLNTRSDSE